MDREDFNYARFSDLAKYTLIVSHRTFLVSLVVMVCLRAALVIVPLIILRLNYPHTTLIQMITVLIIVYLFLEIVLALSNILIAQEAIQYVKHGRREYE